MLTTEPLFPRMIAIFDEDGGGDVDFQEFVSGLSAFSSKGNKEEKLRFAFKVYDIDRDGYISNGELFIVLKMMVGSNLKDMQLQQIVDKTIMEADQDGDGMISFDEFKAMVENTDVSMSLTLGMLSRPHLCVLLTRNTVPYRCVVLAWLTSLPEQINSKYIISPSIELSCVSTPFALDSRPPSLPLPPTRWRFLGTGDRLLQGLSFCLLFYH